MPLTVDVGVEVDGQVKTTSVTVQHTLGTIEVKFPAGYPEGKSVAISMKVPAEAAAFLKGSMTASKTCSLLTLASGQGADMTARDGNGSDAGDLAIGADLSDVSDDMSAATDLSSTDLSTPSEDMTSTPDLSGVDMVYKALTWTQQTTTLTGSFLSCSSSGTDVWITGMPAVVGISTDSGTNWNPITMPDTSASPFSVRAVSSAEVYIAGVLLGGMSYAKVYKSTNKTTFAAVYTSQSNELTAIHGGSKLFAVGKAGLVIRSTNAGATWPAQNTPSGSSDVSNVYVAPDGTPFVTVGQFVYKSLDGGTTWLGKKALPDGATISDISGVDELNVWIVGNAGTTPYVYKTNDSGGTWDPVTVAAGPTNLAGVFARSKDDVLIVGGAGAILHFFNGSMKTETSNVSTDLNAVCGLGDSKYIVVGKSATILRGE